jgi:hypothetical protein
MYSFLCTATSTHADKPLQARPVLAQPKGEEHYRFFTYKGAKPVTLNFRGNEEVVKKGDKFGVRKSSNGKQIRLIFPDEETRVFTLTQDQANALAKGVKQ